MSHRSFLIGLFFLVSISKSQGATTELHFSPTDSATAIQTALNGGADFKKVVFTPGLYQLKNIVLNPAKVSHVFAHGAKFLFPRSLDSNYVFKIVWTGTAESPHLLFEGGEFDLNEAGQGRVSYELEHQAAFFLNGEKALLNLSMKDITVRNSAGDGIYVYYRTKLSLQNLQLNDCFRGGLTVGGGGNEIIAEDLDLRGKRFRSGLRIEPNSTSARNLPSFYTLDKVRMSFLNFQLGPESAGFLSNSSVEPMNPLASAKNPKDPQAYVFNQQGTLLIHDCAFDLNRKMEFRLSGNSRIDNSVFRITQYDSTDTGSKLGLEFGWYYDPRASDWNRGQRVDITNCKFSISKKVEPTLSPATAIRVYGNRLAPDDDNHLVIKDTNFEGDFVELINFGTTGNRTHISVIDSIHNELDFNLKR